MAKRNINLEMASNLIIKVAAVGIGLLTSRWSFQNLSAGELETLSLVTAYNTVIFQLLSLGIYNLIQKFYTNEQNQEKLARIWTTLNVIRLSTFLIGCGIILVSYPLSQTNALGLILMVFSAQFVLEIDNNYRAVCNAYGHSWQFSLTDFISKIFFLVILYGYSFFITDPATLKFYILAIMATNVLALIADAIWQRSYTRFGNFDWNIVKENWQPFIFLTITMMLNSGYETTDRLLLKYFGVGTLAIVAYQNAYLLFERAKIITSMTVPLLSSMIKKRLDGKLIVELNSWLQKLQSLTKLSNNAMIILEGITISLGFGIITCIGMIVCGPWIIRFVDVGLKYEEALGVLPILALALIPYFPMQFLSGLIIFYNQEKFELITAGIVSITGISLYIWWIPQYGLYGAAWATLLTYVANCLIRLIFLSRAVTSKQPT